MKKHRISTSWTIILVTSAVMLDVTQAVLEWVTAGISDIWDAAIVDPIILASYWLVFKLFLKVNFTRTRALVFFCLAFLEFIPIVKDFPLWSADIIAVIMMVAAEDRLGGASRVLQDPKTMRRVGRGVMRGVNAVASRNPRMQARLDKWKNERVTNRQIDRSQSTSRESIDNNRDNIIAMQKAKKQNNTNEPNTQDKLAA